MENVSRLRARDSVSTRKFPGDEKEGQMAKQSSNPECTGGRSDSRPIKTRLNFTLERESSGSKARAATFQTLHGEVRTPIFSPVGTQATVKGQTVESLKTTGARLRSEERRVGKETRTQ